MPTFTCEFDVEGDLVLPEGTDHLQLRMSADFTLTIRNETPNSEGHVPSLIAVVVGPAQSIESAPEELRWSLAKHLDLLAFVTQSRFQIVAPRRLFEWEADQNTRQARLYLAQDARYPPQPGLIREYIDTVQALDQATPPPFTQAALKYFRYGLLDRHPEDQFMLFWIALEIIAENLRG